MATAEAFGETDRAWRGSVFGLTIEASEPIENVPPALGHLARRTTWRGLSHSEPRPWARAETLVDLRRPSGAAFMSVERDAAGNFRVAAPGFGEHFVSSDGVTLESRPPEIGGDQWQRLFFAQVVPLAAAAQGLDLLHASAVELEGRAVAFTGASGVGKTSLTAQLVARGYGFITDDVLAVDTDGVRMLAYAGPGLLHLDPQELDPRGGDRFHVIGPSPDDPVKLRVRVTPVVTSLPLAAVVFVRRGSPVQEPELKPDEHGGARAVLGAAFLSYMDGPGRLSAHLDVCSRLAAAGALFELVVPDRLTAAETADFLRGELPGVLQW
jgi:hypothetical protein